MNLKNQGFIFPLLVSVLLLTCFIGYFLHSEYEKEVESMILQERDSIFVDIFTQFNGDSPSWVKDTVDGEIQFSLAQYSMSDSFSDFMSISNSNFSKYCLENEKAITHDDSIKIIIDNSQNFEFQRSMQSGPHANLITMTSDSIPELSAIVNRDLIPFQTGNPRDNIKTKDVLIRILPQILFSTFLLGSIFLSFLMIGRSLSKERQLANLRTDFMSNMSHELKTPVSTISVALEALSNFNAIDDIEKRKEYIDISKIEIDRLGLLVDKTLNISLFEQGKFIQEKQITNLKSEIEKVLSTLKVSLESQNATVNFASIGNDFNAMLDKTHIINVVHNLIENAIKYSPEFANIFIELKENPKDIILSIRDTGKGIPLEYQDKVFDKFFRIPEGNTHNTKGHGLGLSYVKEVIEKHQGSITLESQLSQGSTFTIQLPKR